MSELDDAKKGATSAPAKYIPKTAHFYKGEAVIGVIPVLFKGSSVPESGSTIREQLETVQNHSLEQYFKIYSCGIVWPKVVIIPSESVYDFYRDKNFWGYYCEYDFFANPIGWKDKAEGEKRVSELKKRVNQFVKGKNSKVKYTVTAHNYLTELSPEADPLVKEMYKEEEKKRSPGAENTSNRSKKKRVSARNLSSEAKNQLEIEDDNPQDEEKSPHKNYAPCLNWGDPAWPNSSVQITNSDGQTLAHEFGHVIGAPDVYRLEGESDGIGGTAAATYGPTANAFSRFYHHAFYDAKHYLYTQKNGSYTLRPRHITPGNDDLLGVVIPSSHPHYLYHIEYVNDTDSNPNCGGSPSGQGLLVSVINLALNNYQGSPDYFYTYRPGDPFFRGKGDMESAFFSSSAKRDKFNMETDPSARLPNLIDGGLRLSNIRENEGICSFDLQFIPKTLPTSEYKLSLLPQIKLLEPRDVQPARFALEAEIKFRGEPLLESFGFCWSTRKNPTVKDGCFTLTHPDLCLGHATNLKPNTAYFVRAFVRNELGVRYSDEEFAVKTPVSDEPQKAVAPLLFDRFSNSPVLYRSYAHEVVQYPDYFVDLSAPEVLAKLFAYYKTAPLNIADPAHTSADGLASSNSRSSSKGTRSSRKKEKNTFNFDLIHWNPNQNQFKPRHASTRNLYSAARTIAYSIGMYDPMPSEETAQKIAAALLCLKIPLKTYRPGNGKSTVEESADVKKPARKSAKADVLKFPKNKTPLFIECTEQNEGNVLKYIRQDLEKSRPLIMVFAVPGTVSPPRWCVIDGIDEQNKIHISSGNSQTVLPELKSGYYDYGSLFFEKSQCFLIGNLGPEK